MHSSTALSQTTANILDMNFHSARQGLFILIFPPWSWENYKKDQLPSELVRASFVLNEESHMGTRLTTAQLVLTINPDQ